MAAMHVSAIYLVEFELVELALTSFTTRDEQSSIIQAHVSKAFHDPCVWKYQI
jgi:hypothetical protein